MSDSRLFSRQQIAYLATISLTGVGLALVTTSNYGVGISNDGILLLSAAENFLQGNGLTQYDGTPLIWWPPLYSFLVAILSKLTNGDPLFIGMLVNTSAFGMMIILMGVLFRRVFPRNPEWFYIGTYLMIASVSMLNMGIQFGTDPIFIVEFLLFIILSQILLTHGHHDTVYLLGVLTAVSMFTRYNGIVFAISGVIIIFYYYFEKDIREGIKYVFWFTLISGTPMALWIAFRNFPLTGTFVGAREYVNIAVAKNIVYSYEQIVRWFIPLFVTNRLPLFPILLIVTAMLIAYAIKTKWDVKRQLTSPSIFPIIVISIVYLVFVVITTETRDRFFFYDDRYLIPLYGPALILIFLAIQNIRATEKNPEKHSYNRNLFLFLFAIWSIYPLWSEYKFIRDSIQDGIPHYNIYNLRSYQESSFIEKLQEFNFDPELQIFSNNTQAVYFSTGNSSVRSIHEPEQIFTNIPDIEYLLDNHNEWFNGDEAYLIWFLPNAKHNYFPPRQLINVYDLEPIIISDDGIVLLIRSKS